MTSLVPFHFISMITIYSNVNFIIILTLVCLLFCNMIYAGKRMHTTSLVKMAPDILYGQLNMCPDYQLLKSNVATPLPFQLCLTCYSALATNKEQ